MNPADSVLPPEATVVSPRVLLVDRSSENRQVLRMALERRGAEILEAGEIEAGLAMVRGEHPDVIVVDLEVAAGDEDAAWDEFNQAAGSHAGRLVILGNVRRSAAAGDAARFFSKPYHFAPLIHKIEQLMGREGSGDL